MFHHQIVVFVILFAAVSSQNISRLYPNGRAFPTDSLNYVKFKFKQISPNITWDTLNYLEAMSANLSSCNYPGGLVDGVAKIPANSSWVAFIEYENSSATAKREVVASLNPVIDKWLTRKRYNMQIIGALKFGCSVNPGCGFREDRMAISCVFSPSSPKYIHETVDYDDVKPPQELKAASSGSEPIALTADQYLTGQLVTRKRWERGHFLENLSRLETSCSMLNVDFWDFNKHRPVIYGINTSIEGIFRINKMEDDVDLTIDIILPTFKDQLPPNIQIGCTYIADCRLEEGVWIVLSCLYEERCRKQLCF